MIMAKLWRPCPDYVIKLGEQWRPCHAVKHGGCGMKHGRRTIIMALQRFSTL